MHSRTLFLIHNPSEKFKNIFRQFENLFFFYILQKEIGDAKSVLDVGCGNDSAIGRLKKTFGSEGIDIYPNCIKTSESKHLHDKYKLGDIRKLNKFYKPKSFDILVSIDVIEHLTKEESLKMISDMEKIARKKIVVMTPQGYLDQEAVGGNPYQVHHSGWMAGDLEKLGYKVYGMRGLKYLRDEHASIKFRPWLLWGLLTFLSEPVFYFLPKLAFQIFAVKNLEDGKLIVEV